MFEDIRKLMDDGPNEYDHRAAHPMSGFIHEDGHFLGMTPAQRFFVAVLFLLMIVTLGVFFLLVTLKMVPPLLS